MKCPFKLPLMADSVPKLIFEADAAGAIIVAGDAKKAYAVRAINSYAALVEALRNMVAAHDDWDGVAERNSVEAARALLAELEQET